MTDFAYVQTVVSKTIGIKSYIKELNVTEARTLFKHRTKMTRYIKTNYKNDPLYTKSLCKCENCANIQNSIFFGAVNIVI